VCASPEEIGARVAAQLLRAIAEAEREDRRYLLGLPTGRTPRPVYQAMAAQLARAPQSLGHVILVMMDEYVVPRDGGAAYFRPPASPLALPVCHRYVAQEIIAPLDDAMRRTAQTALPVVWFPDPDDVTAYEQQIAHYGGIDCFVLAAGASDGHVAFNGPGSPIDSRTRIVPLSENTRRDNLRTFPALGSLDAVPTHGVTVGIATIVGAREALMLAWGADKRDAVARVRAASGYEADWPATVIHACRAGTVLVDVAAA
jgi:glucosamine-6-phosphate deaminase